MHLREENLMKQLTKIKVLNWHLFQNKTIEVSENMLIVGENGSGKSTLLDAIQFVLTAGKREFNKAAHDKGKRNLEGYVRGKLGVEETPYLRQGYVVSHVALEFVSREDNTEQVLGVVIESPSVGSPERVYFYKTDTRLDEDWFLDGKKVRTFKEFKAFLNHQKVDLIDHKTVREQRKNFANTLGVDQRYFSLVPKALAFKPINDLHQFIFDYLLNEAPLDVDDIRNSVRDYRTMHQQFLEHEQRRNALKIIVDAHHKNSELKDNLAVMEQSNILNEWNIIERNKKTLIHKRSEDQGELNSKERYNIKLGVQKSELVEEDISIRLALNSSGDYSLNRKLNERKQEIEARQKNVVHGYDTFVERYEQAKEGFSKISNTWQLPLRNQLNSVGKGDEILNRFNSSLQTAQREVSKQEQENGILEERLKRETKDLENRRDLLNRRKFPYKQSVIALKTFLKKSLSDHFNEDVSVETFSENLEVVDESWRNAIEGYLNTQRFDLLIEDRFYVQALYYLDRYRQENPYHGVGLVDVGKLSKYVNAPEGSLATKVKGLSNSARLYANYLLGSVICVDDVALLREHKKALTASCIVYAGYVARSINPNIYQTPFIGTKALEIQSQQVKLDLKEAQESYSVAQAKKKQIILSSQVIQDLIGLQLHRYYEHYLENIELTSKLKDIKLEISSIKNTGEIVSLIEKQDVITTKISEIDLEITNNTQRVGALKDRIASLNENIDKLEKTISDAISYKLTFEEENAEYLIKIDQLLNDLTTEYKNNLIDIKGALSSQIEHSREKIAVVSRGIESNMMEYERKTNAGYGIGIEYLQSYLDHYHFLNEIEIRKTQDSLILAQKKSERIFQESFISELKANIENAIHSIKELNRNLKVRTFGSDQYEFVIEPSKQAEFKDYYNIIMSGEQYESTDLFMETLSTANRALMKLLFDKISMFDENSVHEAELKKYTDYRYYMNYDIVTHHENGTKTYFSKVSQEKSGGETQVPFYVIIASSFEQLIQRYTKEQAACIVLFDEAFNNMDESRIKAMMEFYNVLNIQVIIAVPPNRVETISQYVQTIVAVAKHENYGNIKVYKGGNDEL